MNRGAGSNRRRAPCAPRECVLLSTASPTKTPGHTAASSSAFETSRPAWVARHCSSANAFGASATGSSLPVQVAAHGIQAEFGEGQDAVGRHGVDECPDLTESLPIPHRPRTGDCAFRVTVYTVSSWRFGEFIRSCHAGDRLLVPRWSIARRLRLPPVASATGRTSHCSRSQALRRLQGTPRRRCARHAARAAAAEPRRPHLPGQHEGGARAAVHEPGPQPHLRLQPRRGQAAPSPRRRGSTRRWPWRTGARRWCSDRTSTRRWCPEAEPVAFELVQKAVALESARDAARARLHRRARRSATPASPTIGRPADRAYADAMRARDARVSGRPRRPHALCRGVDGPAAVELLDARRPAVRRDAPGAGDAASRCWPPTRTIPARFTSGFTCGSPPTRRSVPRPKPIACCR